MCVSMEKTFRLNKLKVFLYVLFSLSVLGLCIVIQVLDPNASTFFNIINYLTMIVSFYYTVLFILDLFAKNGGVLVNENGIRLNYGYYKNIQLPWERITGVNIDKRSITVLVDNPDYFFSRLPITTRILIYTYKNKFGTIFLLKGFLVDTQPDDLYTFLHDAFKKYAR